MDMPEAESAPADYLQNISIHSALISKSLGDAIKKALNKGEMVNIKLDWTETLPYPDEHVEYEFWTNSNDECGTKCDSRINFVKDFKGAAQTLEKKKVGLLSQKKLNIWMDFPWLKTSTVLFVPASMARQPLLCIPFS